MPLPQRLTPFIVLIYLLSAYVLAIDWPVAPFDQSKPIGNSYGEFQAYGGSPYMHPGIDIMAPASTPIYAVKAGYVKAVLTISAELHWRVAIGDSPGPEECDGWLYAHLDYPSITVNEGEYVTEGQLLGNLVSWPVANFHHLHFVKIRNSGVTWNSNWQFIANPLDELEVIDDPEAPVFEDTWPGYRLAFVRNESGDYFPAGSAIDGDVDIVCRAYDYINDYNWRLAPYRLEYMISGDTSLPWTNSVCFTGPLDFGNNVEVVYRIYGQFETQGDYNNREYYFNLTNTDGDSLIEASDWQLCWQTAYFPNGIYKVYMRAYDRAGNNTLDSMSVEVANFFALSGSVLPDDGDPDSAGAVITAISTGVADTTDEHGYFEVAVVPGGWQEIEISRPGYVTADTLLLVSEDRSLNVILEPNFIAGDANYDGNINIADVVYQINFIFHDGPRPIPYYAGDANSDRSINIGDAVYLLNFIFHEGPPPLASL